MFRTVFIIVSLLLLIICHAFMYLYLTCRQKESKKLKDFFSITFNKLYLISSVISLVISSALFIYGYVFKEELVLKAFVNSITVMWLFYLGYIDLKEKIIPNKLIVAGIGFWAIVMVLEIFVAQTPWKQALLFSLLGAGICGGILFVVALLVKTALGMGDVKMFFVIGLLYGLNETYSILLFSLVLMALVSVALLIAKKVTRKTAVPMAPFVFLGFLINVLIGM